ncbi:MAG: ubiquinol-cytochrome c reductase iron-sulfur subunit [Cyanophyceae cyanobacterium]
MNRREFLGWISVGMLASSLPVVLAACNSNTPEADTEAATTAEIDTSVREDGFQAVGTVEELETDGSVIDKMADVLVVRTSEDELVAVNPLCTHQGCTVDWETDAAAFVCPCHGSKFGPTGEVLSGPAQKPLSSYEAKIEDNLVLAKVS